MARRYAIVGSGIAGLEAADAIRERQPNADIRMISEERHDFYSRPGLAYLLRGDLPEKALHIRSQDDLKRLNIERINACVEQIFGVPHELLLSNGERIGYDRLLLATGALAVPPQFPGSDLAGVVKLDSLNDARAILKLARRRRPAVVVGGGITALELAEGLNAQRMQVHYFLRGDRYWADVLDETESRIVQKRLEHEGVVIHLNTQVKQAVGRHGRLTSVETQTGETIPCELLAVAIGVKPRIDLAREAGLVVDRGIKVNEFLETSMPDVFAAGDCAQVFDPVSGCDTLDVLWPTALDQGKIAGANMTGGRWPYVKGIAYNVTQLAGLRVTIIGAVGKGAKGAKDAKDDFVAIARGDSEAWRQRPQSWAVTDCDDINRVRILTNGERIVGALVMGEQTWSRPLQRLIANKVDIAPIRDALLAGGDNALASLADFYQRWDAPKPAPIPPVRRRSDWVAKRPVR